ncbi:MAG: hypothetical protein LBC72_00585 [Spirochaetaceae bacterium]|nr:hypothetical protein [Spirochaetaceae bacterium]
MKRLKPSGFFVLAAVAAVWSCQMPIADPPPAAPVQFGTLAIDVAGPGVYPLNMTEASHVTLNNLNNHDVYFVQLNLSSIPLEKQQALYSASAQETAATSGAAATSAAVATSAAPADAAASRTTASGGDFDWERYTPYEPAASDTPLLRSQIRGADRPVLARSFSAAAPQTFTPGVSTRSFWVRRKADSQWYQVAATLRIQGSKCMVWVADDSLEASSVSSTDNKITPAQAQALADKFDAVYDKETLLFGFEYGGGAGGNGGVDGLSEIQILVYDIDEDAAQGDVIGYFWWKDEVSQESLNASGRGDVKSNAAEIFYMDTYIADRYPSTAHSTLIHEFQHMINYNKKTLRLDKNPASWYNEMLSMLAEDVLDEFISISMSNTGHPVLLRITKFLQGYNKIGVGEWFSSDVQSYANNYAFGAFLARNFGGALLVKEMMDNDAVDKDSVTAAVNTITGGNWTFNELLEKFAETLVFTSANGSNMTFNKSVSSTIGGTVFSFGAFNIATMLRPASTVLAGGTGPYYFKPDEIWSTRPNALVAVTGDTWKNINGSLTVTLNKPAENSKSFIMVKNP